MAAKLGFISRVDRIDWDFTGNASESRFSSLHWQPGQFASQIPAALIGLLSDAGDIVLDPFAGSATTLVEAQRLGRRAVGIELNPVSCLAAEAKTLAISAARVKSIVHTIERDLLAVAASDDPRLRNYRVPVTVQGEKWYEPRVLRDLAVAWSAISKYNGAKRIIALFAFSSILLKACRETRHWGYICDNSTPKSHRTTDIIAELTAKLAALADAYESRDASMRDMGLQKPLSASMKCCDALAGLAAVKDQSIDLVVTSPPYFGVCDYIKSQRLTLEWLGKSIEPMRLAEIGARSKRHRKSAIAEYIEELERIWKRLARTMKQEGFMALVVGESTARPEVLPQLRECLFRAGLKQVREIARNVSAQRRQAPSINREQIWILRRT